MFGKSSNLSTLLSVFSCMNPKEWWRSPTSSEPQRSPKKSKHQIKRREASRRAKLSRKKNRKY